MSQSVDDPGIFLAFFPFFFAGMWLFITTMLGALSGWFDLQARYPRGDAPALLRLGRCSGSMGVGVAMRGILTLEACAPGLRIGVWRVFGPFQRPFLVPWDEVDAQPRTSFFYPMVRLYLGRERSGALTIDARAWQRLVAAARPDHPALTVSPPSDDRRRFGLLAQWAVATTAAASFFTLAPRLAGAPGGPPLAVAILFPAIVFGIPLLVRYFRGR